MMRKKVYSDILPHFGVRITSREIVPAGRIFSYFLPLHPKPLPSSSVAFSPISDNEKGPALCDRTGTISREAAMFASHLLA